MSSSSSSSSSLPLSSSTLSSTSSSQQQIMLFSFVEQNNYGLKLLQNGNIIEARKFFTNALRGAQIGLDSSVATTAVAPGGSNNGNVQPFSDNVVTDSSSSNSATTDGGVAATRNSSSRKRKNATTTTTTTTEEEEERRTTYHVAASSAVASTTFRQEIFSRFQALPTTSKLQDQGISIFLDSSSPLSCANMALIYAVIIYNMGLVYHVRGKQCQNDVLLRKAFELYDKAYSIVLVELVEVMTDDDDIQREMNNDDHDHQQQQLQQQLQQKSFSSNTTNTKRRRRVYSNNNNNNNNKRMTNTPATTTTTTSSSSTSPTTTSSCAAVVASRHRGRNPIVDLLRLSLLKQMANIQQHLSNFQEALVLAEETTAFIMSVGNGGGGGDEFVYQNSRVTELMQLQVACFLMYSISLQQQLIFAPAA